MSESVEFEEANGKVVEDASSTLDDEEECSTADYGLGHSGLFAPIEDFVFRDVGQEIGFVLSKEFQAFRRHRRPRTRLGEERFRYAYVKKQSLQSRPTIRRHVSNGIGGKTLGWS